MPRRKLTFEPGMFCHVVNRGVDREPIFFREGDYRFFLRGIGRFFLPRSIAVLAYCLMPNHYHLLLRVDEDVLAKSIQRLSMSFSLAMNLRRRRTGPLFTGRFRSTRVATDEQLVYASAYIHLNPVRAGLTERPVAWSFSSYRAYLGRDTAVPLDPSPVLTQFLKGSTLDERALWSARGAYSRYVDALAPGALKLREPCSEVPFP